MYVVIYVHTCMPHIYVHICMAHMHAACICALLLAGRACNILFCLSCVCALCVLLSLLFPVVVYLGGMNVPARHRGCMRRIVSLNTLELGCLRTIHTACKQQRNIFFVYGSYYTRHSLQIMESCARVPTCIAHTFVAQTVDRYTTTQS